MIAKRDLIWLGEIMSDYATATNLSDLAMVSARLEHNIDALCQREYHRGFEDGKRVARKEMDDD